MYGLKQGSRQWYENLHLPIGEIGFVPNNTNTCFYIKRSGSSWLYLLLYVDDILIAGYQLETVNEIKQWLKSRFEMKDMGEAEYVIGIEITRDRLNRLLTLSQGSYLETVLKRFDMTICKPTDTPICKSIKLSSDQGPTSE